MKSNRMETMHKSKKSLYIALIGLLVVGILAIILLSRDYATLITAKQFDNFMQTKNAPKEAWINEEYIYFIQKDKTYKVFKEGVSDTSLANLKIKVKQDYMPFGLMILLGIFVVIGFVLQKKNYQKNVENITQSNNQDNLQDVQKPIFTDVSFDDVAGISEAKEELLELVDFLKNPKKYKDLDINIPKGVLLVGPPGVGKTLIAKAMATQSGVPFFYQSGASFVQIYAGMGAKRVRELFAAAKRFAPSIVFIDEIDAVGKSRGGNRSDERESTLNELLTQIDGFDESSGVVIIGATNNVEVLDDALLRSGRFDRKVFLELPNFEDRCKIFNVHLKNKRFDFDIAEIAKNCVGFSGAAIASLVNEAALYAFKKQKEYIQMQDILAVKDKVFFGRKMLLYTDLEQKEILSIYQAGKALSAYRFGFAFEKCALMGDFIILNEKGILSQEDLQLKIRFHLSGILSLNIFKHQGFVLGAKDLEESKKIANEMLAYEMIEDSKKTLEELKKLQMEFLKKEEQNIFNLSKILLEKESLNLESITNLL